MELLLQNVQKMTTLLLCRVGSSNLVLWEASIIAVSPGLSNIAAKGHTTQENSSTEAAKIAAVNDSKSTAKLKW